MELNKPQQSARFSQSFALAYAIPYRKNKKGIVKLFFKTLKKAIRNKS